MNDFLNTLAGQLLSAVGALLTAAITYGITRLGVWLKAKTKSKKLQDFIDHALGFTEDVVITVNQTLVDELKKEGKFDKDAQKAAFDKAFAISKSMISKECHKALEAAFGDVDIWLTTLIESKVEEVKQQLK